MTIGELKSFIASENITDDFEIDVMGEYSQGSFGSPLRIEKRTEPFPDGDYKELQLFIKA
ncbi:hypothetical protein LCGC14_2702180 [marine sediment metagenome]|uniref:Uncharacterized protein n=1 Tax=marine sediment metagenome TaxID=412755 RepID=A0A0F8ZFI9_9ZZZZ